MVNPCLNEDLEVSGLLVEPLDVRAGFTLDDPQDRRYQKVIAYRTRFGTVVHRAANALQQPNEGEDHIDAVIGISKAIDVYLLEYAMTRGNFDSLRKAYTQQRESVDDRLDYMVIALMMTFAVQVECGRSRRTMLGWYF